MTDGLTIEAGTSLTSRDVTDIIQLVDSATTTDCFAALNEAALLHLRHAREEVLHLLARRQDTLVGYAQLESSTGPEPATATGQLVVAPGTRQRGVGAALLAELVRRSPAPLRLWAMGNSTAAQALAAGHGLIPARELLIMTRSLGEPLPPVRLPATTSIRTFVPGQDEEPWLRVNAAAFRTHPEQGHLTRADLEDRMAESWFDPTGFFLAVRREATGGSEVVGFHWTKQHPDRLGEVYVLGVDPGAGGAGLGTALLGRGLAHLQERGNTTVELYVEADSRAVGLYRGYGFTVSSRDVMYAQP